MKKSELRQLIREEISKIKEENNTLSEGKIHNLNLFGLFQSEDGNFYNIKPFIYFEAPNLEIAEKLADEYTNGEYSKYKNRFMQLQPQSFKIYK
jgi:hypothetical protein